SKIMHAGPGRDLRNARAIIIAAAVVDVPSERDGIPSLIRHPGGHRFSIERQKLGVTRAEIERNRKRWPVIAATHQAKVFHPREKIVILPAIVIGDSNLREQTFLPAAGVEETLHRIGTKKFLLVDRRAAGIAPPRDAQFS